MVDEHKSALNTNSIDRPAFDISERELFLAHAVYFVPVSCHFTQQAFFCSRQSDFLIRFYLSYNRKRRCHCDCRR